MVWPLHLVMHRARLGDRFLDWLVSGGYIVVNPLAELRGEYRQHSTAPIVRALADPDPAAALEKLRKLPPFGSHLGRRCVNTFPACGQPASAMGTTETASLLWIGFSSNSQTLPISRSLFSSNDGRSRLPDSNCAWRESG